LRGKAHESMLLEPRGNSVARQSLIILIPMRRAAHHKSIPRASAFRRVLTVLLVAAYVIVGFGGEVSCAEESLIPGTSVDVIVVADRADEGSKQAVPTVEHCYTCAPLVMPVLVPVAEPSAQPIKLSFDAPMFVLEDHPWLDTPPPKHLT
jgi:hypothetical protein